MKTYWELQSIMDNKCPDIFVGLKAKLALDFKKWLPNNMHIYSEFIRYALILKNGPQQRKYYSGQAIWERIRWDTMLADRPEKHFKLNDHSIAFITRLAMEAEPELEGMFQIRGSISQGEYKTVSSTPWYKRG